MGLILCGVFYFGLFGLYLVHFLLFFSFCLHFFGHVRPRRGLDQLEHCEYFRQLLLIIQQTALTSPFRPLFNNAGQVDRHDRHEAPLARIDRFLVLPFTGTLSILIHEYVNRVRISLTAPFLYLLANGHSLNVLIMLKPEYQST